LQDTISKPSKQVIVYSSNTLHRLMQEPHRTNTESDIYDCYWESGTLVDGNGILLMMNK
jgi:hypothetical protein